MKKEPQLLISLLIFLIAIISEAYLLWLFPFTGLAGLVCWPIAILTAICSAVLFYQISKKIKKRILNLPILISLIFIQTYVLLWFHPQDFGGDVFHQIRSAVKAYNSYETIQLNDYSRLNRFEKVVFIKKYESQLPPSISTLTIDERKYLIWNYKNKREYDKNIIDFIETDSSTTITEVINANKYLTHNLSRNFLNNSGTGVDKGDFFISISRDEIENTFDSGIEQMLFDKLE